MLDTDTVYNRFASVSYIGVILQTCNQTKQIGVPGCKKGWLTEEKEQVTKN